MLAFNVQQQLSHFELLCEHQQQGHGITGLLGPSGSGKTTLLRIIAGLNKQAQGFITLDNRQLLESKQNIFITPSQREVGFVFQDDRLFPHLTVLENLLYGVPEKLLSDKLKALIEQAGIAHLLPLMPKLLSAGERQRVALLRAIFAMPKLLLLDEPLAHLDAKSTHQMISLIRHINQTLKLPMIYISHDHFEIQQLADEVLVMEQGQIIQRGDVHQVMNNLTQDALHDYPVQTSLELSVVAHHSEFGLTELALPNCNQSPVIYAKLSDIAIGAHHRFFIKADEIALSLDEPKNSSMVNSLKATISDIAEINTQVYLKAKLKTHQQEFNLIISKYSKNKLSLNLSSQIYIQFKAGALSFL